MTTNHYVTWVLNSNTNACRLYQYSKKPLQLSLLKEIQHPENRLRDIELTSDKPGHYQAGGHTHGAFSQETDPKEIKIDSFSREIAKELNDGRNNNAYAQLIIIAAPHMSGLLLQHMNKHVKELISHSIKKDMYHLSQHELLAFLQEHG